MKENNITILSLTLKHTEQGLINLIKSFKFWLIAILLLTNFSYAQEKPFIVFSPDIKNGDQLKKANEFSGFGCPQTVLGPYQICVSNGNRYNGLDCNGKNIAPRIKWENAPKKTLSFAFTMFDPDMPNNSGWWHFVVYNIPYNVREIIDGKIPEGSLAALNDSGTKYYMGPCPPRNGGQHRYIFTIHALNVEKLDIPPTATAALTSYVIRQHTIAASSFFATYSR